MATIKTENGCTFITTGTFCKNRVEARQLRQQQPTGLLSGFARGYNNLVSRGKKTPHSD